MLLCMSVENKINKSCIDQVHDWSGKIRQSAHGSWWWFHSDEIFAHKCNHIDNKFIFTRFKILWPLQAPSSMIGVFGQGAIAYTNRRSASWSLNVLHDRVSLTINRLKWVLGPPQAGCFPGFHLWGIRNINMGVQNFHKKIWWPFFSHRHLLVSQAGNLANNQPTNLDETLVYPL